MIKNDRIRMLCRSISESNIIAWGWLFIVFCKCIILSKNNKISKSYLLTFMIMFSCLLVSSKKDYKERLKNNNTWRIIHYLFSVIILLMYVYSIKLINSKKFNLILFLTLIFFYTMIEDLNEKISIILELVIVYSCNYLLLHDTYNSIK